MQKIAFLFLIYEDIYHEELWNIFFKGVSKDKYSIYIHYKTNKPLKYFEEHKLEHCIETEYANISLVKAQNLLLEEALKDKCNQSFIFLSDSCIPLKTLNYIYEHIDQQFSYFNIASHSACFPRCNGVLKYIHKDHIQKASQWCILKRAHAELMVASCEFVEWFQECSYAPDEHVYISNIYHNNLQNEIITTPDIAEDATTFTNGGGTDYKYASQCGLKNYTYITKEELLYLLESKSLFGRKFHKSCKSLYIPEYVDFICTA
jgi:hypothetical protein